MSLLYVPTPLRRRAARQGRSPQAVAWLALLLALLLLAGCAVAAAPVEPLPPAPTPTATPTPVVPGMPWIKQPPSPVTLPADEAPHDVLTEWWYYTGHLSSEDGARYGFEFVIFQVRIGGGPPTYLSHAAVTDVGRQLFRYDQRQETRDQPSPAGGGFDLSLGDWRMHGRDGRDRIAAGAPGYAFDLSLTAQKPPALHLGTGYISFGPAGDSYYYSRTRMAVEGTLEVDGQPRQVRGSAWFDHQWGDFISVRGGGWDWFSLQLSDKTDIMLFSVRDPFGGQPLVYGTLVGPDGTATDVPPTALELDALATWTSPHSGATYPSGWRVRLPGDDYDLTVTPVLADQELDTRPTTGVIYWEGAVDVSGTHRGSSISGAGYVELTGYAK